MTVETYTPGRASIGMTDAAAEQARGQLSRENAVGLKLDITTSGCSGYMYIMDFVKQPEAEDEAFEAADGVTVYVPKKHLRLLDGTEIDWVTEGVNSFFKFRNPNAEAECGCGESFSVSA
jgi:Fe-S cluster assembly protein SufA/iron-sulfur cluster assembly protein